MVDRPGGPRGAFNSRVLPRHVVAGPLLLEGIAEVRGPSVAELLPLAADTRRRGASAGNRTRVTSMATMYSTTRPLMLMHRGKPESRRGLFQSWTRLSTGEPGEPPRRGRRAFESCSRPGSLSPSEGPGQFWGRGTAREVLGVLSALECFPAPPPIPPASPNWGQPSPRRLLPRGRGVGGLRRRRQGVAWGPEAREAGKAASARADWLSESAIV